MAGSPPAALLSEELSPEHSLFIQLYKKIPLIIVAPLDA